ncbi:MAG: LacI family transcriptional regulator [Butyrivibrio sp.]|uniref:LacI family DNA-binding transcriptional regulator n=1 Tax=Butyrivibrio sp. NC2002 TaxID=1410610 RepID=UPI00056B589E|nr:LacI family DNA-binding transcriptional regulator [Butyrivibrio sp. NC2002]MBE5859323.1 LacI family transcriptional regulator [Butyrivibrio sp.]
MAARKAVSLKDIAAACNVSVATVSKALNDQSDIGEETKNLVRQTAEEMGYFPNFAAKALKTNRTYNIGILFMDDMQSGLTHSYFSRVIESFKKTIEERGYDLTFISNNRSSQGYMSYLAHARYRNFDGVAIACVDFYNPEVEELVRGNIPVVTIDHVFNDRSAIVSDNVNGMKELVTYIIEKGHRKIAYIHGAESAVTKARVQSFYKTTLDYGIDIPDEYIYEIDYRDTEAAKEATDKLLSLDDRPTCIIYPDDFSAFGGINSLKEHGLRIPEDISIAGYDGIDIAMKYSPQLTTIVQDTDMLGRRAAEKLIDSIENPKTSLTEQVNIPGHLNEGETVSTI